MRQWRVRAGSVALDDSDRPAVAGRLYAVLLMLCVVAVTAASARLYALRYEKEPIVAGPGVTAVRSLSYYFAELDSTVADTEVFELAGQQPGGTVLVIGGTHPREPAGYLAAVVLVENAVVRTGRLLVIPRANNSAFTHHEPGEAYPDRFAVATPWGSRWFRYGDRLTSPVQQWPDPDVYVHYPSGQRLSGFDVRNLDRAYPGRPDGNYTERVAHAITQLVRRERVDLVIDLHEAPTMYPVVNVVVAHQRGLAVAGLATILLGAQGIPLGLEASPVGLRGLSHRELGDHTQAISVLLETANPMQDRLRGPTTTELLLRGEDAFVLTASRRGLLFVPYDERGLPLEERVGRHLSSVLALLDAFSQLFPHQGVAVEAVPGHADVLAHGVGYYLLQPPGRDAGGPGRPR